MFTLAEKLKEDFVKVLKIYISRKSAVEKYLEQSKFSTIIMFFFGRILNREIDLARAKKEAIQGLVSSIEQDCCGTPATLVASTYSGISIPLSISVLLKTPDAKQRISKSIVGSGLVQLEIARQEAMNSLNNLRDEFYHDHKGQSEGILEAMHVSINYLIHMHIKFTLYLLESSNSNDRKQHVLDWIEFLMHFLCCFVYDLELNKYSLSVEGHLIDKKFFQGVGPNLLDPYYANELFITLHSYLVMAIISYSFLEIFEYKSKGINGVGLRAHSKLLQYLNSDVKHKCASIYAIDTLDKILDGQNVDEIELKQAEEYVMRALRSLCYGVIAIELERMFENYPKASRDFKKQLSELAKKDIFIDQEFKKQNEADSDIDHIENLLPKVIKEETDEIGQYYVREENRYILPLSLYTQNVRSSENSEECDPNNIVRCFSPGLDECYSEDEGTPYVKEFSIRKCRSHE